MTSQGRSKQSKASEVGASPIQSHPEATSANHEPSGCAHMKSISNAAVFQAMSLTIGCKPNTNSTVARHKNASRPI